MAYQYEVRRPYLDGPERWETANTVSAHATLADADRALQRQQTGAARQGGYSQDAICEYRNGSWRPI